MGGLPELLGERVDDAEKLQESEWAMLGSLARRVRKCSRKKR